MEELIKIELAECCKCHIPFWVSIETVERWRRSKETFYCPNGHSMSYQGKSDKQKIKEALDKADRLQVCCSNKGEEIKKLEKSIIGHKGAYAKLKKKVS